jgi:hypothetical protein
VAPRAYVLGLLRAELVKTGSPWIAVHASRSLVTAVIDKPYVVVHFGNQTEQDISSTDYFPHQTFVTIYFHDVDEPVSYTRINEAISAVKAAFRAKPVSPVDNVMDAMPREVSQDLADPVLQTVFRYLRVQLNVLEAT